MLCDVSGCWAGRHGSTVGAARVSAHTTSHTAQAMVTMTKLGGRLNIADTARPIHTETRPMTVETAIAADRSSREHDAPSRPA